MSTLLSTLFRGTALLPLAGILLCLQSAALAQSGVASAEPAELLILSTDELQDIVGPVALYPDDLLAVVLPASTFPVQIVQAARYLEDRASDDSLAPDPRWDESVVALLNYPDVLDKLSKELDWTQTLGDAVVNQQPDVIDAIETFRDRAYAAGNLKSDDYQRVEREDDVIRITPAQPQVVYVPYYEPARVVIVQREPVYHYYSDPYPLYYYPYDRYDTFYHHSFWGITSAYRIGWHSHSLNVVLHSYASHPYHARRYVRHHYYHDHHQPRRYRRAAHSRGGYVNSRDRNYRGDQWQPHARATRRAQSQASTARPRLQTNTFRPRPQRDVGATRQDGRAGVRRSRPDDDRRARLRDEGQDVASNARARPRTTDRREQVTPGQRQRDVRAPRSADSRRDRPTGRTAPTPTDDAQVAVRRDNQRRYSAPPSQARRSVQQRDQATEPRAAPPRRETAQRDTTRRATTQRDTSSRQSAPPPREQRRTAPAPQSEQEPRRSESRRSGDAGKQRSSRQRSRSNDRPRKRER